MLTNGINAHDLFQAWKNDMDTVSPKEKFTRDGAKAVLYHLACSLVENSIKYEEAKLLINRVPEVLCRSKSKSMAEIKKWGEDTKNMFLGILTSKYTESLGKDKSSNEKTRFLATPFQFIDIDQDPIMLKWAKAKFGSNLNDELKQQIANPSSALFLEFLTDTFTKQENL